MRVPPRAALVLVLAVLVAAAAGPAVAPSAGQPTLPPEQLSFEISLQADGDARWRIVTRLNVTDPSDRRAFRDLADRFVAGERGATYDVETFRRSAALASNATGRSMRLTDVRRTNETVDGTGRLVLSFTWTNFGTVETTEAGRELRIGDAFNTSRPWFPGLTSNATLVVEPPPGYTVFDAPKPVEQGAVVYRGPTTFEPDDLRIVFRRTEGTTAPSASPDGNGSDTPPGDSTGGADLLLVGLFVVVAGAIGVGAFLRSRRDGDADAPPAGSGDDSGGTEGGSPAADDATVGDDDRAEPAPPAADAADGDDGDDEDAAVDLDLLSDEERVEYLLERNGGRMKQATIVKETGWSNAKVSQLLSSMDEAGRIDKLRIGRENLISLPDEDVADILDDEDGE
ncbi:MAG: helix-turn-helix transcriptional regulator [Haloarculaceae archaeon]